MSLKGCNKHRKPVRNISFGFPYQKDISLDDFSTIRVISRGLTQVQKNDNKQNYALKEIKYKSLISGSSSKSKSMFNLRLNGSNNHHALIPSERQLLCKLDHPFIASIKYAFGTKDKFYLVCDTHNYRVNPFESLKRRFGEALGRFYSAEMFLAIKYLHSKGIIFGHFCADNIFLDKQGHIKIMDLNENSMKLSINDKIRQIKLREGYTLLIHGYLRTISDESQISDDIIPSEVGTLICNFMDETDKDIIYHSYDKTYFDRHIVAPELMNDVTIITEATDWWSFGAILYKMMTGLPPVGSGIEEIQQHANWLFKQPQAKDLCLKILVKDVRIRFGSTQIEQHEFYKEIDWDLLYQKKIAPPGKK